MSKKKIFLLSVAAILVVVLIMLILSSYAWFYTEEQHMARISKRVEEHYMTKDSGYTSFEVYPVYNEYDKLEFAVVEFQPHGFMYVHINKESFFNCLGAGSMYTRDDESIWYPYTVAEGEKVVLIESDGYEVTYENRKFEYDENGEVISYTDSHFRVRGMENEKRYLVRLELAISLNRSSGYVPAVRRGDKMLNLISMQEMDYTPGMTSSEFPVADIYFLAKKTFDL